MALPSFTAPLAALTTIFTPPCPTSWFITTTKIPSQEPPFPPAGPVTCDPPQWDANLEHPGFEYYSPAICPSGFAVGPRCEVKDVRTNEGFPPITAGETAAYCVPSGFTCTSDTTDFRGGVWGVVGNTNAPPSQIVVTVAPAMQIRWRDADLAILQTHPLTPGLVLLTSDEPEPTGTSSSVSATTPPQTPAQTTPAQTTPPPAQQPSTTSSVVQLTLTSTAEQGSPPSPPPPPPPPAASTTTRPAIIQDTTQSAVSTPRTSTKSSSSPTSIRPTVVDTTSGGTYAAESSNNSETEMLDWRTGAIAMVLSALLVTIGVVAFVCVLLRRKKPNDPWSRFMRSPSGQFLTKCWNALATTVFGLWVQNRATQIAQSRTGVWVKQRWANIRPPRPVPDQFAVKKEFDPEYGMPTTPVVAELDADQRLGSPGNPAELDGYNRWSMLKGTRSSASSASLGVMNRVKTWLATTTQPSARWTRSVTHSRIEDRKSHPYSVKSSRPGSTMSGMGPRASAEWDNFSPVSLKVPTAAHITRAHQRNNSLADVLDASVKAKAAKEAEPPKDASRLTVPEMSEVMNRLSAGTFGAGRASQIIDGQSTDVESVPALPSMDK